MERTEMNGVLERLLGLEGLCVNGASLGPDGLVVHVWAGPTAPRCGICNDFQSRYGRNPVRRWRHLALERTPVWLSYAPRRVKCPAHGVRVQRVPWAAHGARYTTELEQMVPWLCRRIGIATTSRMMGISWRTAERLFHRAVIAMPDLKRIEERYLLGADALSLRSHSQELAAVLKQLGRPMPTAIAPLALPASAC
jgi:transposase